ncbi:MAG: tetratricopeptide repeat protein [Candidatus Aminicenantales bacterium]
MRKIGAFFIILLFAFLLSAHSQVKPDEELFQKAKILIFDKKWLEAQQKLEELLSEYPQSLFCSQAIFYRAKCLFEQKDKEAEALEAFQDYLELKKRNESLAEESEVSIIDLALRLYEKGRTSYLKEIEKRLESSSKAIRYYAALQLSFVREKRVSEKAIPTLREIVEKEEDAELRDRAKIALLRIKPNALSDVEEKSYESSTRVLKIRIYSKRGGEPEVRINIPWALADLALSAIPEKEKQAMRKEGYDLDRIVRELRKMKGEIITIEAEDKVIKIWIE